MLKNGKIVLLGILVSFVFLFASCQNNADVVPAKELCDKQEMAGLTKVVSSEEELVSLVKDVVAEMEKLEAPDRAAKKIKTAKTPEDALAQIDDYISSFVDSLEETLKVYQNKDGNYDFENIDFTKLKFKFNFDKAIEIGEITFSDWIDVVAEAMEDFVKEFKTETSKSMRAAADDDDFDFDGLFDDLFDDIAQTKAEIKKEIIDGIEIAGKKGNEAVAFLDNHVVIKKVGVDTAIVINIDAAKFMKSDKEYLEESILVTNLNGKISFAVKNIDDFFKGESPVKGFSVYADGALAIDVSAKDAQSWMTLILGSSNPLFGIMGGNNVPTLTAAAVAGNQEITAAVCTSEGKGGYITLTATEELDAGDVIDLAEVLLASNNYSDEKIDAEVKKYLDNCVKVTISVSNGKKEVWSEEYKYSKFVDLLKKFEDSEKE